MFFFFKAEDGIRDIGVTGVQTCALPIFARHAPTFLALGAVLAGFGIVANWIEGAVRALPGGDIPFDLLDLASPSQLLVGGSGERRVGEECRFRWAPGP